jgi:hypothetical protein
MVSKSIVLIESSVWGPNNVLITAGEVNNPESPSKLSVPLQRVRSRSSKPFCLETACVLMECSWQTYFVPLDEPVQEGKEGQEEDIVATALASTIQCKMNVAQYGLQFVRSFHSPSRDLSGYLVKTDRKIIVSFRGTVGSSNVITDINMLQTRLPDLALSESHLRDLFSQVVRERRMSNQHVAKDNVEEGDVENQSKAPSSPLSSNFVRLVSSDGVRSDAHGTDNGIDNSGESKNCDSNHSSDMLSDDSSVNSDSNSHTREEGSQPNRGVFDCIKSAIAMVPVARQALPLVHYGFWAAYKSIREEYLKAVMYGMLKYYQEKKDAMYSNLKDSSSKDLFRHSTDGPFQSLDGLSSEFRYPLELYITGHSLGGALAVLAAVDLQRNAKHMFRLVFNKLFSDQPVPILATPSMNITLYTFGSPRIGNAVFAKLVETSIRNTFRVEVDGDFICRIPRLLGMYRHCGVHIIVDAEETGNIIVNPTVVESQLLRRGSGTTDHHSLNKYRPCLEACFLPHELESYLRKCFLRSEELAHKTGNISGGTNPFDEDYYRGIMPDWV